MKPLICVAAEGVVRDAETNNVSIFNILEGVTPEGFPVLIQRIALLALWERDEGDDEAYDGNVRAVIDGEELFSQPLNIDFAGKLRNRSIVRVQGLVIPTAGKLKFTFEFEPDCAASYAVTVNPPPEEPDVEVEDEI